MAARKTRSSGTKSGAKPAKKVTTVKKASSNWTLSGVSQRTRSAVTRAAKKDETPVGKWVDRTLREVAETRLKGGPPSLALPPELLTTLSELSQNLKTLSDSRPFGSQAIEQVQTTASEVGDQVLSTYAALVKQADAAIGDVRSWTDETRADAVKWTAGLIEQLKDTTSGVEKLQGLMGLKGPGDTGGAAPVKKSTVKKSTVKKSPSKKRPSKKPPSKKPRTGGKPKSSSPGKAKSAAKRAKKPMPGANKRKSTGKA